MLNLRATSVAALAAVSLFASTTLADLEPLTIKGSKFFHKNGTQFFIRGVAYQQDYTGGGGGSSPDTTSSQNYNDPLADTQSCLRDIPYLQKLRTNVIRVYAVDPTKTHDACMRALSDAGIYVIADLSAPVQGESIDRNSPAWDYDLVNRYNSVVDALQGYSNVLGFFAGNEVANAPNNTFASAFVKAAVRDTKAYISKKQYRTIPVGYAANDDQWIAMNVADYMDCGSNSKNSIDFFGYNIYSWCGDSNLQDSSYAKHTKDYSTYNVPVFFSEYGCNTEHPRKWTEVAALFGKEMTPVWSGGIVYMYFEEANDYGLVVVQPGGDVKPNDDYKYLSSAMASVSPSGTAMSAYNPTNSAAACPTQFVNWTAAATPLPPTPNKDACSCMMQGLSCVVSSAANEDKYGDLFDYVCHADSAACDGIAANGTTGKYGPFGACSAKEKLSYVFDQYYNNQKKVSSACAFSGAATIQTASQAQGTCSSLLASASAQATGGGSSGGSGSASSSSGAAGFVHTPSAEYGLLPAAAVLVVGVMSGVGMIML